jgi:hypothetical protein
LSELCWYYVIDPGQVSVEPASYNCLVEKHNHEDVIICLVEKLYEPTGNGIIWVELYVSTHHLCEISE